MVRASEEPDERRAAARRAPLEPARGLRPATVWISALVAWAGLAWLAGHLGGLAAYPPPFPQLVLLALLACLLLALALSRGLRMWLFGMPLDALVGVHLSRLVGGYFLWLHARGELPYDFAVLGGWGDIGVATGAAVLIGMRRSGERPSALLYYVWNLLGLIDLLFVVSTAARLALRDASSMAALTELPLSLLPSLLVPLLLFTHIVIWLRLRGARARM